MKFETTCVQGSGKTFDDTGAMSVPIFQTATFKHPGVGMSTGYDYSRLQNPTREFLEETVAKLEEGVDAMAFSTGMAALTALMELFRPGDHIIASDDLYGGSHRLFFHINEKNGITADLVDTSDLDALKAAIRPETKAIFVETPTNPMMKVTDLAAVAALAKDAGALLVVDNTFLTPYFQKPLTLGADVVLHSGTKFLGGHNDTLAGFLVVGSEALSEKLRFIYKTTGACLAPFDSWLILRGIKTLAVRLDRQQQSALKIAEFLQGHKNVTKVYYVGLPEHPGHALSKAQASGFGSMISFKVKNESVAKRALEAVRVIGYAESLGGVESLITYPMLQTHADIPEEERLRQGIDETLLRLSVGLEDVDDLIGDLAAALEG